MTKTVRLYKPYLHQKAVHDAITAHIETEQRFTDCFQKIFVVKACRQVGKSLMAENELVRFALHFPGSVNAYVAPGMKLSKKIFREIRKMFTGTKLIERANAAEMTIEFINGSSIGFFSAEQRENLRGYTVSGILVIDESAIIPDKIYTEALSPWVDAHKAATLIISTPKFKLGFFYDYFLIGLSGKHNVQSFDFMDFDLSHIRSADMLLQKRSTLPAQVFRSEYLGMFLDAEGSVFGNFSGCVMDAVPDYEKLYFGLDFGTGSGKDFTVLTAVNEKGEQVIIWRTNDLQPGRQIEAIAGLLNLYKPSIAGILAEENGIGKVYLNLLKQKFCPVHTFTTTNASKRKLVEKLQVAIQNREIGLLKDTLQTNELSLYEAAVNPATNKTSYNAPAGMHDDHVMALMLAYECYSRQKQNNFRLSFI